MSNDKTIDPCLAEGVVYVPPAPPPPPPVVIEVVVVTYTTQESTAAAAELAGAFAAPTPAPEGTPPPPPVPVVEIAATVGFTVDIAEIAEGSPARTEFETGFKTSMAASIGGGAAVTADKVIVDAITGSRRRLLTSRRMQSSVNVDFHIIAPASVAQQATSLIAAVDTSSIVIGDATASEISAPVVTAPPNVDCAGAWDVCGSSCADKAYRITAVASGSGSACTASHGATATCSSGDGACTGTNCVGAWSACAADCADKTYTVSVAAANGGSACAVADGATQGCAPGHGACPPTPAPVPSPTAPATSAGVMTAAAGAYAVVVAAAMTI
jgi:hypothetical protein